jgi:hypothetical protein
MQLGKLDPDPTCLGQFNVVELAILNIKSIYVHNYILYDSTCQGKIQLRKNLLNSFFSSE